MNQTLSLGSRVLAYFPQLDNPSEFDAAVQKFLS